MTDLHRSGRALVDRARALRANALTNPRAISEWWTERRGQHPTEAGHAPHYEAALEWMLRAQTATEDHGFARGYSLVWDPYFRRRGWQPSYPETTGYIIPTLLHAARILDRPEFAERALQAAQWEIELQLPTGAVRGGVIGEPPSPAIFNTGQVLFGWLAAYEETQSPEFAVAAHRASRFLVDAIDDDGHWRKGNSHFARADSTLYNARAAWALAASGLRLGVETYVNAAAQNLRAVASAQQPNGWLPSCCLDDPSRPLLHTLAYATRGLLEGGSLLGDASLIDAAGRTARALLSKVDSDGFMPGRFDADWHGTVPWSCLTGDAQMASVWIRLFHMTGDAEWLEPVPRVLHFLKSTQNRRSGDPGLRGGIKGAFPISGGYGRFQVLSWATKFFVDALLRHDAVVSGKAPDPADVLA